MFDSLEGDKRLAHWSVRATFVELYNEAFKDLLCTSGRPELRLDEFKCAPRAPPLVHNPRQLKNQEHGMVLQRCLQCHC